MLHQESNRQTHRKIALILLSAAIVMLLIVGCTPKELEYKNQLVKALEQKEAESYAFTGSATLQLNDALLHDVPLNNPITNTLLKSFLHSKISWDGAVSKPDNRWEMLLSIQPSSSILALDIPMMLKDGAFLFQIPLLSQDEYWSVDTADWLPVNIAELSSAFTEIVKPIITNMNEKSFSTKKEDKTNNQMIHIELSQQTLKHWVQAVKEASPAMIDALKEGGMLDSKLLADWEQMLEDDKLEASLEQIVINEPGGLTFTLNKDKRIVGYELSLNFKLNEQSDPIAIELKANLDQLDEKPEFKLNEPESVRSFQDILNTLFSSLQ